MAHASRRTALLLPVFLALAAPVAAQGAWTSQGGDPGLTRWSPLRRISLDNVANLAVAWTFSTGSLGAHEGGPLVADSLLFVHTPYPTVVYALDLRRPGGPIVWRWAAPVPRVRPPVHCCETGSRGLAWHPSGRLYVPLLQGEVAALDARTGKELWRVKVADGDNGATLSGAPLVAGDVVVVGVAGGEFGVRGFVTGLDAGTGQQLWTGYSTGPDAEVLLQSTANVQYSSHQGRNLGQTTWPGEEWRRGGGAVPGWLSYDPTLALLFYGSGPPAPWNGEQRPGDNKWTSTLFAREVTTGRVRWAYQTTPHDAWAYGAATEAIVADLTIGGTEVKALIHPNPNGYAYTLDRATGRIMVAERFGPANWAQSVDPATGTPIRDASHVPSSARETTGICPSALGAMHRAPGAFSPTNKLAFLPVNNLCMSMRDSIAAYAPGKPFIGASVRITAGPGGNRGRLVAWDAATGTVRWEIKESFPVLSGVLATAAGLVFYGTLDGWLKAVDQERGRERWRFKLPSGIVGGPMMFAAPDGREYLAVLSGVGGWAAAGLDPNPRQTDGLGAAGALADLGMATTRGGTLFVFEPGK